MSKTKIIYKQTDVSHLLKNSESYTKTFYCYLSWSLLGYYWNNNNTSDSAEKSIDSCPAPRREFKIFSFSFSHSFSMQDHWCFSAWLKVFKTRKNNFYKIFRTSAIFKHLVINTSKKNWAQRFDDLKSSFSSEKRIKFDNLTYKWFATNLQGHR